MHTWYKPADLGNPALAKAHHFLSDFGKVEVSIFTGVETPVRAISARIRQLIVRAEISFFQNAVNSLAARTAKLFFIEKNRFGIAGQTAVETGMFICLCNKIRLQRFFFHAWAALVNNLSAPP